MGNKSQRRISIANIGMLTLLSKSTEFVIHILSEYDYHFVPNDHATQRQIGQILKQLYVCETQSVLLIVHAECKHLAKLVMTKKMAKNESRNSKIVMRASMMLVEDQMKVTLPFTNLWSMAMIS